MPKRLRPKFAPLAIFAVLLAVAAYLFLCGSGKSGPAQAIRNVGGDVGMASSTPAWAKRYLPAPFAKWFESERVTWVSSRASTMTEADMHHLAKLIHLRGVNLMNIKVTDAGLVHLKGLVRLDKLILAGPGITDQGLVNFTKMQELKELYLINTIITDSGLVHLQGLRSLRFLTLGETKVTDAGAAGLQRALPNLHIRMKDPSGPDPWSQKHFSAPAKRDNEASPVPPSQSGSVSRPAQ